MSEKDEAIDEDDEVQQAYGSRSLEWTNKYRSVIPYEKARISVMDLGLRNKSDWDEYVADGKVYHGPYLQITLIKCITRSGFHGTSF